MGAFRALLRIYEPDDAIFDGTYELPDDQRQIDVAAKHVAPSTLPSQ
jgi:hypothetical protein